MRVQYISAGWVDIKYKLSKQPFSSDSLQGPRPLDKTEAKYYHFCKSLLIAGLRADLLWAHPVVCLVKQTIIF